MKEDGIAPADFFTTEVWMIRGLVTHDTLFVIDIATRHVHLAGTKIVRTSIQAPDMNAFAERFVRSIKSEFLDRMIFVGGASLDRAIREFTVHSLTERPHQGLENALIAGGPTPSEGRVEVTERLGGLLKHYYRKAAQDDVRVRSSFRTLRPPTRDLASGNAADHDRRPSRLDYSFPGVVRLPRRRAQSSGTSSPSWSHQAR